MGILKNLKQKYGCEHRYVPVFGNYDYAADCYECVKCEKQISRLEHFLQK